jgi:8-oxo-dGTP pyrophosphatase MutT (NUDIX family)
MTQDDFRKLTSALSLRLKIIGRRRYTNAAVIVPFILRNDEYHFLFEMRAPGIPQGSEVCFPGGEYDGSRDASLQDTAVRETVEELGISEGRIAIAGRLGTVLALRGVAVDCFPAVLDVSSIEDLVFDRNEVERLFTLPVAWFRRNPPETYPLKVMMHPVTIDEEGRERILFPAAQLGLPEKYRQSWQGTEKTVLVYRTAEAVVWGMTAEIIYELVSLY